MSPEEYQKLSEELGIRRGALADGFEAFFPSMSTSREPNTFRKDLGPRVDLRGPPEDLSHLNPPLHEPGKRSGKIKYRKTVRADASAGSGLSDG